MSTALGQLITKRRSLTGLSQEGLAKKIGFKHGSQINRIENGERRLMPEHIVPLANALGVTGRKLYDVYMQDYREMVLKAMHRKKG